MVEGSWFGEDSSIPAWLSWGDLDVWDNGGDWALLEEIDILKHSQLGQMWKWNNVRLFARESAQWPWESDRVWLQPWTSISDE